MEKELVSHCPRCSEHLIATHLICKECDLELTGDFELSNFDYLSTDDLDFVKSFLKYHGSFKAIQEEKGMSYPAVKKRITQIVTKLGIENTLQEKHEVPEMSVVTYQQIEPNDSPVIARIKEKLNDCGGKTTIKLLQGDSCEIWFDANGRGIISPKIPPTDQLIWEAFDAAVEIVIKNGGKAAKGKARSGARLGSDDLPFHSVEGYIAHKVHGVQEGESAFGPGFVIAAVLSWASICNNERGFLSIHPGFLDEYGDKLLKV